VSRDLFAGHIPLLRPWLADEEIAAVTEVLRSGWIAQGPKVAEFETAVARMVGARAAIATNSATTALHLMLAVAGIGPGDEVLLPSFTCMATANAVVMAGSEPRFADIERRTYNLDVHDTEARVGPRTRAVLLVDQIGLPADQDAFRELCRRHGLLLLEDAATAFGARYKGRMLGGTGLPTVFSFHPRKVITTGEGGMLLTDDEATAERARALRSGGASVSDLVRHEAKGTILQAYEEAGFNYRMTDLQGAIGLVQLGRLGDIQRERRAQAAFYGRALAGLDEVETPYEPEWAQHAWSSYCVRVRNGAPVDAPALVGRLAARGISCRHGIPPLHHEPYFRARMSELVLPETEAAARETLFLPIFPGLTAEQQAFVVQTFREALRP
jgi:dTDP-4-amino-4,6-dideoxygalactose transaminase